MSKIYLKRAPEISETHGCTGCYFDTDLTIFNCSRPKHIKQKEKISCVEGKFIYIEVKNEK